MTFSLKTKIRYNFHFYGSAFIVFSLSYQIAHALENLCEGFPWLFEVKSLSVQFPIKIILSVSSLIITQICWRLVEACMDDLIEMIIESGLNPKDMCEALFLCP